MTQEQLQKLEVFKSMPTLKSSDNDWLKWVDLLDNEIGRDNAKTNFIALWEKRGSKEANTNRLRSELKRRYDIDIDENFFQKIIDIGGGIGDTVRKATKIGLWVVGGVVVVVVASLAISIAKDGVAGTIKKVKP